ncbi:hypothetical protein F5883DRAFT_588522, partial [Diaporthe sp. PMI_573]
MGRRLKIRQSARSSFSPSRFVRGHPLVLCTVKGIRPLEPFGARWTPDKTPAAGRTACLRQASLGSQPSSAIERGLFQDEEGPFKGDASQCHSEPEPTVSISSPPHALCSSFQNRPRPRICLLEGAVTSNPISHLLAARTHWSRLGYGLMCRACGKTVSHYTTAKSHDAGYWVHPSIFLCTQVVRLGYLSQHAQARAKHQLARPSVSETDVSAQTEPAPDCTVQRPLEARPSAKFL